MLSTHQCALGQGDFAIKSKKFNAECIRNIPDEIVPKATNDSLGELLDERKQRNSYLEQDPVAGGEENPIQGGFLFQQEFDTLQRVSGRRKAQSQAR